MEEFSVIIDEHVQRKVQEHGFKLGYGWCDNGKTFKDYLNHSAYINFYNKNMEMRWTLRYPKGRIITVNEFLKMEKPMEKPMDKVFIYILNETMSKEIQNILFDSGYSWMSGQDYCEMPSRSDSIGINSFNKLGHSNKKWYLEHDYKEITLSELMELCKSNKSEFILDKPVSDIRKELKKAGVCEDTISWIMVFMSDLERKFNEINKKLENN